MQYIVESCCHSVEGLSLAFIPRLIPSFRRCTFFRLIPTFLACNIEKLGMVTLGLSQLWQRTRHLIKERTLTNINFNIASLGVTFAFVLLDSSNHKTA